MVCFWLAVSCIDIVRGSIVYDDAISFMNGINNVRQRIEKGDTCVKKILRIKNLFESKRKKWNKKNKTIENNDYLGWLYQYGDIKFNILIENENLSLIGMCYLCLCGLYTCV